MIDKNDVKMPVQRDNIDMRSDPDQIRKIEDLLDLVNAVENRQELRLKNDYYSRFHWFGSNMGKTDKSYFSYQEEAVYDFIFNLNKSGILSDQVGMGKTIEAGMIISELASRNELRSLLIIVPNEIMAQKWEYELENKFGIKHYIRTNANGAKEVYPQVKALKNFDDFCKCVFDCLMEEKFAQLWRHKFQHKYNPAEGSAASLEEIVASFIKADINEAIEMINSGFEAGDIEDVKVSFDGNKFYIKTPQFTKARDYTYDHAGEVARFLNGKQRQRPESVVNSPFFANNYERIIKQELVSLYTLVGEYFTTTPEEISALSDSMINNYPILVIPINYTQRKNGQAKLTPFLNRELLGRIENYKHKYMVQDSDGRIDDVFEPYRIVDFFIDVGYQTMIVDEVHDYIDVCAKINRDQFHKNPATRTNYPSSKYDRYELFDEYHFIEKKSLYKKLKSLADKANRKIFLTATPIKSDMVDFYLLTLLASNKDADAYKKVSDNLEIAFPDPDEREEAIMSLYNSFESCGVQLAAKHFCDFSSHYFAAEDESGESAVATGRYRYPYFNNSFLHNNIHNPDLVKDYMLSQLSYMSMEELILELILSYTAESGNEKKSEMDVKDIIQNLEELFVDREETDKFLRTRVIFRGLFNNTLKARFEEDFTTPDGKPIKRIRELLELEEGARKWHKTYRKYGIRHTRHQTYNLSECAELEKLSKNRIERYKNLPLWPKRDGKVIFLLRDDIFFDCFLKVRRSLEHFAPTEIKMEDLPNYDKLLGNEEQKEERFQNAIAIFDYINNAMSGGEADTHEPFSSTYDSVDLNDDGMIEYKLALVNKLMEGKDSRLGAVSRKVLLFAETGREEITNWFKYQRCAPLYQGETLDENLLAKYQSKWQSYEIKPLGTEWRVSEDAEDLSRYDGNLLIIIDPSRYEKGVDLQKADTLINFDINYCPLKMEQRIGRIDRIRPSGQTLKINIVSFVPLNDMSGFVINFFANEMKMFTQWMGETTGIVSVPEDAVPTVQGEDVSFEGRVANLETYYKYLYTLCTRNVENGQLAEMIEGFRQRFNVDDTKAKIDFSFLQALRSPFDRAFRNSISPQRAGYQVQNDASKRVMRFNSSQGAFGACMAATCNACPNREFCRVKSGNARNSYETFFLAVKDFFRKGIEYYNRERRTYQQMAGKVSITNANGTDKIDLASWLQQREEQFTKVKNEVEKLLPAMTREPFTMEFARYEEIFNAMKKLYWDTIVEEYMNLILDQFHKQCDSVLSGARLFERFVKVLSIADFMNNMEGTV